MADYLYLCRQKHEHCLQKKPPKVSLQRLDESSGKYRFYIYGC